MKVTQLAVLGVAVIASGGAFFVANNLASQEPEQVVIREQAPQIELEQVLVAARNIPLGTNIKPDMLEWQSWPKKGLAEGFIEQSEQPAGLGLETSPAIARSAFFVGEPIRESKLVRSGKGYMSAILPTGQQAVATSISTATSAGGFILPNDRVDLIMTRQAEGGAGFTTETVLENVRVLAIDQTIEEQDGQAVVVGQTATLQLTPKQVKILTVAQQLADRLTLALRSIEDSGDEKTSGAEYLLGGKQGTGGTLRMIKYGQTSQVLIGPTEEEPEIPNNQAVTTTPNNTDNQN